MIPNKSPLLLSLEYDWLEKQNLFILKWFEGDQLPCIVSDVIENSEGKKTIMNSVLTMLGSFHKFEYSFYRT